jgi:hypothetical protein
MKETKSERRETARHKARHGMRVTGKYFWIAIGNSRAKRDGRVQPGRGAKNPDEDKPQQHDQA